MFFRLKSELFFGTDHRVPVAFQSQFVFGDGDCHPMAVNGIVDFDVTPEFGIKRVKQFPFPRIASVEELEMDKREEPQPDLFVNPDRDEKGDAQPVMTPLAA